MIFSSKVSFATEEIIEELESVYNDYDLHCMNDGIIGLYGEKRMLEEVIKYLKRIKGE